jgi:formylglycine-generating enzyme required for sulfatase activity
MKNKVSVGLFGTFVAAKGLKWDPRAGYEGKDLPALGMTADDAHAFASEVLGGKLPTTQQWAKAAGLHEDKEKRGEGPYRGSWEKDPKPEVALTKPWPVGTAKDDVSLFGCRDMAGNGREWTRSLCESTETVPVAKPGTQLDVFLRGIGFQPSDPFPLQFADLEEGRIGLSRYAAPAPLDVGFRVVLEP